jgi:Fe-S-cluster containining protein
MTDPGDPCGPCGLCCKTLAVQLSGHDVWRLCRGQRVAPETFALARALGEPAADGFRLAPSGPSYRLTLAKQGEFALGRPCVFLARRPDGMERCGVYANRPAVCRAYPMARWGGFFYERRDAACPPGAWPAAAPQSPAWRDDIRRGRMEWDLYRRAVAQWNARVDAAATAQTLDAYYTYLLALYDAVAALDAGLGADARAAVVREWPPIPHADALFLAAHEPPDAPWRAYLAAVDGLISRVAGEALHADPGAGSAANEAGR